MKIHEDIEVFENNEWVDAKFLDVYNGFAVGIFYYKGNFEDLKKVNNSVIAPFIEDGKWRKK